MKFLALGGPVLWLIVFASAVALVVFIQRVLHYHRAQINSMEFLNGVRNVLKRDNVVEALSICDATPGPVARLVKVAILWAFPFRTCLWWGMGWIMPSATEICLL